MDNFIGSVFNQKDDQKGKFLWGDDYDKNENTILIPRNVVWRIGTVRKGMNANQKQLWKDCAAVLNSIKRTDAIVLDHPPTCK